MLIEQKLQQIKLSSGQEAVAQFLLEKRCRIAKYTVKEIAKETYTSNGTIVRLAKKLGYDGFESLKEDYLKEVKYLNTHFVNVDANYPFNSSDNNTQIANKIGCLYDESIQDTLSLVHHDSLRDTLKIMKEAKQIHFIGFNKCAFLGKIFQIDMYQLGININILESINSVILNILQPGDCIIIADYIGNIDKISFLIEDAKKKNIKIIAITSIGENSLSLVSNVTLYLSTRENTNDKIKSYSSEISVKLILDIIYSCFYSLDYEKYDKTNE